jgi:hypothetical protein
MKLSGNARKYVHNRINVDSNRFSEILWKCIKHAFRIDPNRFNINSNPTKNSHGNISACYKNFDITCK